MPNETNGHTPVVHVILQAKGGVGKSYVAAIVAQYYRTHKWTVRCFETDPGEGLVATVRARLERERADRVRLEAQFRARAAQQTAGPLKDIEAFRKDPRYDGDGTRVDLAYAVYAVARGVDVQDVRAALRSRDLSHKGNAKRQSDYIERTVRKALANVEQGRGR